MNKEQIILGMRIYSESNIDFILGDEEQKILLEHIDKLEHNWNELKKYLEENKYFYSGYQGEDLEEDISIIGVLNKMHELEDGGNNDC